MVNQLPDSIRIDDQLELQLINERHVAEGFALIDANRLYLRRFLPWVDHMLSAETFRNYVIKCGQQHKNGTDFGYMIFYEGHIAGRIGIHHIDYANKTGAIGYWLAEDQQKKGIVSGCARQIITESFNQLRLNRIELKCATENLGSKAIAERLGFRYEGILREAEWVNDSFVDLHLFAVLAKNWK